MLLHAYAHANQHGMAHHSHSNAAKKTQYIKAPEVYDQRYLRACRLLSFAFPCCAPVRSFIQRLANRIAVIQKQTHFFSYVAMIPLLSAGILQKCCVEPPR